MEPVKSFVQVHFVPLTRTFVLPEEWLPPWFPPESASRSYVLLAHLLLGVLASQRLHLPVRELSLGRGAHGKPYMRGFPDFHFNLSHTRSAAVCAIGSQPLGVDMERVRPFRPSVAARCFTPLEQAYVQGRDRRFSRVWTRKEAFCKYTGEGLSRPMRSFCTQSSPLDKDIFTWELEDYFLSLYPGQPGIQPILWSQQDLLQEYQKKSG